MDSDGTRAMERLSSCIKDISAWMRENKLKLNNEKSEFVVAASSINAKKIDGLSLRIGDDVIQQSSKIRNLGVILDTTLSMSDHVRTIVKSVNFHLRSIEFVATLPSKVVITLCGLLILSHLDYAYLLMLGISAKERKQLQKLQNRAARIVYRVKRLHPSAPLLRSLHWLPLEQRIKLKVLFYVFKGFHGLAPPYLNKFLVPYSPGRPWCISVVEV